MKMKIGYNPQPIKINNYRIHYVVHASSWMAKEASFEAIVPSGTIGRVGQDGYDNDGAFILILN